MPFKYDPLTNSYSLETLSVSKKIATSLASQPFFQKTWKSRPVTLLYLDDIVSALTFLGFTQTRPLKFEGILITPILVSFSPIHNANSQHDLLTGIFQEVESIEPFISQFRDAMGFSYEIGYTATNTLQVGSYFYVAIKVQRKSNAECFIGGL